jgi:hypothetical protein
VECDGLMKFAYLTIIGSRGPAVHGFVGESAYAGQIS